MKKTLCMIMAIVLFFAVQSSTVMAADTTGPEVQSSTPANGAKGQGKYNYIVIRFDENIQEGKAIGSIKLTDSNGSEYGLWTPETVRNMLVIEPRYQPDYGADCTLSVPAGAVKDAAGNQLQKTFTLKYKVEYKGDIVASTELDYVPSESGSHTLTAEDIKRLIPKQKKQDGQDSEGSKDSDDKSLTNEEFLQKYGYDVQKYIDTAKGYMEWRENIDYEKFVTAKGKDEYREGYLKNSDGRSEADYLIENTIENKLVKKSVFVTSSSCIFMDDDGSVWLRGIEYFTYQNKNTGYKNDIKTGIEYKRDVSLMILKASSPSAHTNGYYVAMLRNHKINKEGPVFTVSPKVGNVLPGDIITITAADPDGILDIKYSLQGANVYDTKFFTNSITVSAPNNPGRHRLDISGQDLMFASGDDVSVYFNIVDPESELKEEVSYMQTGMTGVKAVEADTGYTVALKEDGTLVGWGSAAALDVKGMSGVKDIAVSGSYTAVLKEDGTVFVAGSQTKTYDAPSGLNNVKDIAAGKMHFAALKNDGTVVTWGYDFAKSSVHKIPYGLTEVKEIEAGDDFTVALKEDGTVVFWGNDWDGVYNVPVGLSGVKTIETGDKFIIAIKENGDIAAWGYDADKVPAGLTGIRSVSFGESHTVALKENGEIIAWGNNESGQCDIPEGLTGVKSVTACDGFTAAVNEDGTLTVWGENSDPASFLPQEGNKAIQVSGGESHTMVLKEDGTVKTWGSNSYGLQKLPKELKDIKSVAAGWGFSLALKKDGTVVVWGDNRSGECTVPKGLPKVKAIAAGKHGAALKEDGTVATWGINGHKPPKALTNVVAIAAGSAHTAVMKQDGTVVVWGNNYQKQCNVPKGLSKVKAIAAGYNHMVALKEDGTVVAWGDNGQGQCDVPKGLSGVAAIAAGENHTVALKNDGTAVCWGNNQQGYTTKSFPGQKITGISCGRSTTNYLLEDGTVVGTDRSYGGFYMP
ncbi:MAG TPA: Ig-like domain-containing protein [Clostridia bacterium]|nr:Ig-like domain-containing protein [Clostridia bacterium]